MVTMQVIQVCYLLVEKTDWLLCRYIEVFKSSLEELMTAVMKLQRQQVQHPQPQANVGFGGRGRSYGQMDRYGMGMGPMGMGAPCDAMGYGGRGGGRMGNMGRGEKSLLSIFI